MTAATFEATGGPAPAGAAPRGVVLLCAGRGTRMRPLTDEVPKCMLEVGDRRVIDHLLEAILARTDGEVVAVTGFGAVRVGEHLAQRYGARVSTAHNARFDEDVNILSVEVGVQALRHPGRGYLVVETDLLLDAAAWDAVFAAMDAPDSFWVCRDRYHPGLTGGIVHAADDGRIDAVDYQPRYDGRYDGWPKMVGLLGVGPGEVAADRRHRQAAIAESVAQYYLVPWQRHLQDLPCRVCALDGCFAQSFNTPEDFADAGRRYLSLPSSASPRRDP